MAPARAEAARLDGWELVFDLPVGPGERGVANVRPHPESAVHGVAYWIDPRQGEWLDRSEGVPHVYRRVAVDLCCVSGERVAAFTYASPSGVRGRKPSPRYMGLILGGARHHGLPAAYLRWLESLELAVDERRGPGPSGRSGAGRARRSDRSTLVDLSRPPTGRPGGRTTR